MDIFKKHEKIKITYNVKLLRVLHIPTASHKRDLQVSWKRGSKKENKGESKRYHDAADLELGDSFKVVQSMKQEFKTGKFDEKKLDFVLSEVGEKKTSSLGKGSVNLADCSIHGESKELVVSLSKKDPRFELIVAVTPEWQKIGQKNLVKPEEAAAKGITDKAERVTLAGGENFVLQTADELTATEESHKSDDEEDDGLDFEAEEKKTRSLSRSSLNLGSSLKPDPRSPTSASGSTSPRGPDQSLKRETSQRLSINPPPASSGADHAPLSRQTSQRLSGNVLGAGAAAPAKDPRSPSGNISPRGSDPTLKRETSRQSVTLPGTPADIKKEDEKRAKEEKERKEKQEKKEREEKEKREKKDKKAKEKAEKEEKERERREKEEKEKKEREEREKKEREERHQREEKEKREKEEKERREKAEKEKRKAEKALLKMNTAADLQKLHDEVLRMQSQRKADEEKIATLTDKLRDIEADAAAVRGEAATFVKRSIAEKKDLEAKLSAKEKSEEEARKKVEASEKELHELKEAYSRTAQELSSARSARSSEDEMKEVQLDLAVAALKKEQSELAEVNKRLATTEAALKLAHAEHDETKKKADELAGTVKSLEEDKRTLSAQRSAAPTVTDESNEEATRLRAENAVLLANKREAEEHLAKFKTEMQARLQTLQKQLAEEHDERVALEEERRKEEESRITPRGVETLEAAEARAIKAEEALKATTAAAATRVSALEAELSVLKQRAEVASTPRTAAAIVAELKMSQENAKLRVELEAVRKEKEETVAKVTKESAERVEELEKKLSKEKKRSKKSNNGEVKKSREDFAATEAALRGELAAAREQLAKAEAAAATPQPIVASRGLAAGEDYAAKLRAAEESYAKEVAALRAEAAKQTDSAAKTAEREREKAAAQSDIMKRISAELEATKEKLKAAEGRAANAEAETSTNSTEQKGEVETLRNKLAESEKRISLHATDAATSRQKLEAAKEERKRELDNRNQKEAITRTAELDGVRSKLEDALTRISELEEEAQREKRRRGEEKEKRQAAEKRLKELEEENSDQEKILQLEVQLKLKEEEAARMRDKIAVTEKSLASGGEQPGATARAHAAEERVKQLYIVLAAILALVLLRIIF